MADDITTEHIVVSYAGRRFGLLAGDLIGRSAQAALRLDRDGVSEFHAGLTRRQGAYWLLPLRGALAVDSGPQAATAVGPTGLRLAVDTQVRLPDARIVLRVEAIHDPALPDLEATNLRPAYHLRVDRERAEFTQGARVVLALVGYPAALLHTLAHMREAGEPPVSWKVVVSRALGGAVTDANLDSRRKTYDYCLAEIRRRLVRAALDPGLVDTGNGAPRLAPPPGTGVTPV